jgi:LPXTG-site transpeptidase (sortase) family protein
MKLLVRLLIAAIVAGAIGLLAYAVMGPGRLLDDNQSAVRAPASQPRTHASTATSTPLPPHPTATHTTPTRVAHPVAQPTHRAIPPHPRATPTLRSTDGFVLPRRVPGVSRSTRQAGGPPATVASESAGHTAQPTTVPPTQPPAVPTTPTQPPVTPSTPTPDPNAPSATLSIPRLGIRAPVYERGIDASGQLPIAYGYSVTHYLFSAPLGGIGNYVIYGHDDIQGSIFQYLPNLQVGDFIYLTGGTRRVTYQVTKSFVVTPDQVWVLKPTSTATLTAISCIPYDVDTHRIIVRARLVSVQQV